MKVDFYLDDAGEHRWRAVHQNGQVMAGPQEGYVDRRDMMQALITLHAELPSAIAQRIDKPTMSQLDQLRSAMDAWDDAVARQAPNKDQLKEQIIHKILNFLR